MEISICISLGSLIVATAALLRTYKKDRSEAINSKKALIRAKGFKSGTYWAVKIWNDGQATAKNVRMASGDIDKNDSGITLMFPKEKLPYPLLNNGDSFEIRASLDEGRNPNPLIKFIWDDKYKKGNEREQILEF